MDKGGKEMNKWKFEYINIWVTGKDLSPLKRTVQAKVCGDFAINKDMTIHDGENWLFDTFEYYTLTHLPTGYKLLDSTIGRLYKAKKAFEKLSWNEITFKDGWAIPNGFEMDKFRSICRQYSN